MQLSSAARRPAGAMAAAAAAAPRLSPLLPPPPPLSVLRQRRVVGVAGVAGPRRSQLAATGRRTTANKPTSVVPAPDVGGATNNSGSSSSGGSSFDPIDGDDGVARQQQLQQPPDAGGAGPARRAWRRLVRELASLPRAIALMATVAGLSALGTVIPQNKGYDFYLQNYPTAAELAAAAASSAPAATSLTTTAAAARDGVVLGVLDHDLLLGLGLDHIYTAWYFYGAIALLGASLMACTYTTQLPAVRVAQRWRFAGDARAVARLSQAQPTVLPNADVRDLAAALARRSYQVFVRDDGRLYAFKGLAGRLGPIGVHVALLMCLFGTAYSGFGGWHGSALCPEGQGFIVGDALAPLGALARPPAAAGAVLSVNGFSIDTRPDGSVAQFYSDLTLRDGASGRELLTKTISVNDPFRYGGVTMYQTDWALAAVQLRLVEAPSSASAADAGADSGSVGSSVGGAGAAAASRAGALLEQLQDDAERAASGAAAGPSGSGSGSGTSSGSPSSSSRPGLPQRTFSLPLASLEGRPGVPKDAKLFATFLPLEQPPADGRPPRGISMLARDLETVTFYDSRGQFVGVRRVGSGKPIAVEGLGVVLEGITGSTGLELKSDPGVPLVYAGFGGLMLTTLVSYVSHSQVWALQRPSGGGGGGGGGADVVVAGRSNRAKVSFQKELDAALDEVPERVPVVPVVVPAAGAGGGSSGGGGAVAGVPVPAAAPAPQPEVAAAAGQRRRKQ